MSRRKLTRDDVEATLLYQLYPDLVPREHAKQMTSAQFKSLFEAHHENYVAEGGDDHFTMMTYLPRAEHRERTRKIDVPQIAKNKRIAARHQEFLARMAAKQSGQPRLKRGTIQGRGFERRRP